MATRPCPQCGTPNPEAARFCAQCGGTFPALVPAPAPAASVPLTEAKPPGFGMKTVIGFAAAPGAPAGAPAATAPLAAPIAAPQVAAASEATSTAPVPLADRGLKTMIGMPAASVLPVQASAPPAVPLPSPQAAGDNRTMIGVAMPGIAPAASHAPVPSHGLENKTMLGVAMPGIAPVQAGGYAEPQVSRAPPPSSRRVPLPLPAIVPAPPPLDDSLPLPPVKRVVRRGIPLAAVAGGALALVVVVGLLVVVFWKGGPALLVQPRLSTNGKEQLHLVCESCADGTTASLGGAKATFTTHQADLDLTTPLKLGDNPVEISLDRPGVGRDETVKAVVPVSYRVRADLGDIAADPPVINVRVEAVSGTVVRVEGQPVTLDAQGRGNHVVSLAADTTGPSDEGKVLERTIPYEVDRKDQGAKIVTEKGAVAARVGVIPLRVDAPTAQAVTENARVWVAGRTSKGGTATVNGKAGEMGATGVFAVPVDLPLGDTTIDVRATAPQVAPRSVRLHVRRVEHLETEVAAREAESPLAYDAVAADVAGNVGKPVALEGSVLEARGQNHQTVIVVNDKRGCSKAPCVARVVHGEDDTLKAGDPIRAYGHVTRSVSTTDGKTVPEIEADLLLRGKSK